MRHILATIAALALSACASVNIPSLTGANPDQQLEATITKLSTAAIIDLQSAGADAKAHNDLIAASCWFGLIPVAQQIQAMLVPPPVSPPVPVASCGDACLFTNFQRARDVKTEINLFTRLRASGQLEQIRVAIVLACGALGTDVRTGFVDPLGLISGPARP